MPLLMPFLHENAGAGNVVGVGYVSMTSGGASVGNVVGVRNASMAGGGAGAGNVDLI